jgi:sensor histidine kinase YesM
MVQIKSLVQLSTAGKVAMTLVYTALFNSAIAILLTTVGFGNNFGKDLIFSQCIGLTICGWVMAAKRLIRPAGLWSRALTHGLAMAAGAVMGTALGAALTGLPFADTSFMGQHFYFQVVGISMLFGGIITYFFYSKERLAASAQMIQEERIKRLSSEKQVLEANLKRLQAQIEPHFLFNTLSNILSLMDTDPQNAKSMQLNLIRYLRASLGLTRNQTTTLRQEFELIRAFLEIYKIRMGARLRYALDLPEALVDRPFTPMLIQPLVENAVIHGLEPKIEGGEIRVRAWENGSHLRLEISDTGNGLPKHQSPGLGLSNVQERLSQLYGSQGRLIITENQGSGLTVMLEVPRS